MYFIGIGTATPPKRYRQGECWEALRTSKQFPNLQSRSQAILRKVFSSNNGINTRWLALDPLEEVFQLDPDTLHQRFSRHAPEVAARAAQRAMEDAGVRAHDIDAIIISTCTGYLCPGLTSYVSERLGLRSDAQALDLVGQGCGAAIPNLRAANALIESKQCGRVLSICVEICSAAFYLDDDPGVLISACLFGDGAGAAVLANQPVPGRRRVMWKSSHSKMVPEIRDLLRFEHRNGMLRNILSPKVPALAAEHADAVLEEALGHASLSRQQITGWILHAGGRDVLMALRDRLKLEETGLCLSANVLREFGNLSSPFILFVLKAALESGLADGNWWMASFGAGFSSHGALLEISQSRNARA